MDINPCVLEGNTESFNWPLARQRDTLYHAAHKEASQQSIRAEAMAGHMKRWKEHVGMENNNYIYKEDYMPNTAKTNRWVYYVIVALIAGFCYVNSLAGELVHDDVMALRKNADVRMDTSLLELLRNDFWGKPMQDPTSHKSYRPLCVLTFRLNYRLGGLDPFGYHVINIGLHVIASLVFTFMCDVAVFRRFPLGVLAGSLFAVHPVHTEAVSGIVGRADILACIFAQLSFLSYVRSWRGPASRVWLLLSLILSGCAMLSKEHGITALGWCGLYDLYVHYKRRYTRKKKSPAIGESYRPLIKRTTALLITMLLLLLFRLWMLGGHLPGFTEQDNPASYSPSLLVRVLSYSHVYAFNVWLLISPVTLNYDWQMGSLPLVTTLWDSRNISSMAMYSVMCTLLLFSIKSKGLQTPIFLGLSILVVSFLPASNLFYRVGFVVAERVLYIPSMGYIILVVHGLDRLTIKFRRKTHVFQTTGIVLCFLLASRTLIRNRVWFNRENLFKSGIQILPNNAKMHYNFANLMKDLDRKEEAAHYYRISLRLWPTYGSAHNNLGVVLNTTAEAELHFREAIRIHPQHSNAHLNLGSLLSKRGFNAEALQHVHKAVLFDPSSAIAHSTLAFMLSEAGRKDEAETHYRKVLELLPEAAEGYTDMAMFLYKTGRLNEAEDVMNKAYCKNQDNHVILRSLARILGKIGRKREAAIYFEKALLKSRDSTTLDMAGVFFFNYGKHARAAELLSEAIRVDPESTDATLHLAQTLGASGRVEDAESYLHLILRKDRKHVRALKYLADLHGQRGSHKQAIHLIEKAIAVTEDPSNLGRLHSDLGKHYKDEKQFEEAFRSFKEAVRCDPNLADAQHHLAILHHMKGEYTRARHHYEQAKKLQPENQLLGENIKKLERAMLVQLQHQGSSLS